MPCKSKKKSFYGLKFGKTKLGLETNFFKNTWKGIKKINPIKEVKSERRLKR